MNSGIILLKTLLLASSRGNVYRHTGDKKKKRRIVGNAIGAVLLYAMLMAFSVSVCIGYGTYGLIDAAPVMCALTVSALAFMFTFFKTNGYLFNFREYDMLMSLPFEARTVAACKFLYMYLKSLPWYMSISLAMMIGYGCYARPGVAVYPLWIALSLLLPGIPMLAAAFLGFLVARLSAGFRRSNIVQTALTFAFVILCFSLRFILEDMFANGKVQSTLETLSEATAGIARLYPPAGWFSDAVLRRSATGILLLVGVTGLLFTAVFAVVGRSYRNINSALKTHAAAKRFRLTAQRPMRPVCAIAHKEFRRMTGSTPYMVNCAVGMLLAALLGVITLFVGFDRIVATVVRGAPVDPAILRPAIPFVVHFCIGMLATTACSPSLEGRNYWILQSLPIEKKTVWQGKMLFNLALTVPFMAFSTLCLCVSAKAPALDTALYLLLGLALCAFSTAWGCVCGVRHMRLDWENEIEVIKQGAAVAIYMLPNMFAVMGLAVLAVFLGLRVDSRVMTLTFTLVASALAALSYARVMALSGRGS